MRFTQLFFAWLVLTTAAAHAADSQDAVDKRRTAREMQLSAAPAPAPRLGLLDAQKTNYLVQSNPAAFGNAVAVDAPANTLTAVQRTIVARPNETRAVSAQDDNETASSTSVAWPLLLGLLVVFLRRAPQRFRSNGL